MKKAIALCSIGRAFAGHTVPDKLRAIKNAGFDGIEMFTEDLETFAHQLSSRKDLPFSSSFTATPTNLPDMQDMLHAAREAKRLCGELGLSIINYQPFMLYEGDLNKERAEKKWQEALRFIELCVELGAPIMQMPCQYRKDTSGDDDVIVRDLQRLADYAKQYDITIAWEMIAWGAHIDTWQRMWKLIQLVDRSNVGILLDTAHILGRLYCDPTQSSGIRGGDEQAALQTVTSSMDELARTIPADKIVYVQLSDIMRPEPGEPLSPTHRFWDENLFGPLHMWSRNGRPYPYEGYAPVELCAKAIAKTGFQGWWSLETFTEEIKVEGKAIPAEQARRAMLSIRQIEAAISQ